MNLTNYIVNEILKDKDFLKRVLKEIAGKKNYVVGYAGRFQPFHQGHNAVYNLLCNKFGKDNVYILTSDKTQLPKSPFSFEQKKKIMTTMFNIPSSKIVMIKNPYAPVELLNRLPDSTSFITAIGEKDKTRLGGKYFKPYSSKEELETYKDRGYYFIVPPQEGGANASAVRDAFLRGNERKRIDMFMKTYGKFNQSIFDMFNKQIRESLKSISPILEGSASGHMTHVYEDDSLTFGELKKIINLGLSGKLGVVTEKTDGQNLMFTFRDGEVRAARNTGHLKNFGKNALNVSALSNMFAGRGEIHDAFVFALTDIENAILSLSKAEVERIFKNGKCFMNLEVIYTKLENVIPYNTNLLMFHGLVEVDEAGNAISKSVEGAEKLASIIKKSNLNVQKTFNIGGPFNIELNKIKDYSKHKAELISQLEGIKSEFGLNDKNTASDYKIKWWDKYITDAFKKFNYSNDEIKKILIDRWAFGIKTISILNVIKMIEDKNVASWVKAFDKTDLKKINGELLRPLKHLFLKMSVLILKNINGFVAANPNQAVNKLKTQLDAEISKIEATGDDSKLSKLRYELEWLEQLGGAESIVPSEGIVFNYKGHLYKLTGAFAPLNQILGLLKYQR